MWSAVGILADLLKPKKNHNNNEKKFAERKMDYYWLRLSSIGKKAP